MHDFSRFLTIVCEINVSNADFWSERGRGRRETGSSFGFPIVDEETNATMKNISPSILPKFHGLKSEDPETFLFEF